MLDPSFAQTHQLLNGITHAQIVTSLVSYYGWEFLARIVPLNCFSHESCVKSSLSLLNKTSWAKDKFETLYLQMQHGIK
jgi:uncharacterized protein (DUF2132 family)